MMEDCRAGKIDRILVKSISRLGRNTVQFLQACDMLNALHVDVYFEIEKLYISDPKAVKMLTIYASLYQHESESKSFATRWGILTRFRDGSSKICDWSWVFSPEHSCQADKYASPVPRRRDEVASRDGASYPGQ